MPLKEIKEMITSLNPIIAYSKTHVWLKDSSKVSYKDIHISPIAYYTYNGELARRIMNAVNHKSLWVG